MLATANAGIVGNMSTPGLHDVDARFLMANERTLLAWVRTALTLLAGGVGVLQLVEGTWRIVPGLALLVLGGLSAAAGVSRFRRTDSALRRGELPRTTSAPIMIAGAVVAIALILIIAALANGLS